MIRSMTGFGRASFRVEHTPYDIELRSVNHRHLDVRVRLPRPMVALEPDLRAAVQGRFARGKVDLNVNTPAGASPQPALEIDLELARRYLEAAGELGQRHHVSGALDVASVLALPGVSRLVEHELGVERVRPALLEACGAALDAADAMRSAEGEHLEEELRGRLEGVVALATQIEGRSGTVQETVRERLRKRAQQLGQETGLLDEARLHQEIVIAADRLDITEELVRLRSHAAQFRDILASAGPGRPVGRRLEFLLQEFGREANTVGSKGADAPIAHLVVDLKAEIERLREQVQNIE